METVFLVQHSHVLPSGNEDVKIIGVYRTLDTAKAAIQRLGTQSGFAKHPSIIDPGVAAGGSGFYIGEYELDRDHWSDGFVTLAGDREV